MSIKLMAAIWDNGPEDHAELLVLLCLADHANDQGVCWPSMATIARKCRVADRSARRILRRLEADGWIETQINRGRNGVNVYVINPDTRSPRTESPPDPDDTKPGPTGPGNHQEPSITPLTPQGGAVRVSKDDRVRRRAGVPDAVLASMRAKGLIQ